jgi:hypothetical protein
LTFGAVFAAIGLAIIWIARSTVDRPIYVSELGAQGMPTAQAFTAALLTIAAGGLLVAGFGGRSRPDVRWLAGWIPAVSIAIASSCFVLASQVTCSYGCPVPIVDPRSTLGDLVHTSSAILGFVAACYAMLQVSFSKSHPVLARVSLCASLLVGAITIAGGLLSAAHFATDVGGVFEFVGVTVAIAWLALYAGWLAATSGASGAVVVSPNSGVVALQPHYASEEAPHLNSGLEAAGSQKPQQLVGEADKDGDFVFVPLDPPALRRPDGHEVLVALPDE